MAFLRAVTPNATSPEREPLDQRRTTRALASGASVEALGGVTAVVLSVIGIAGHAQIAMLAAAAIAIGIALIALGGSVVARWADVRTRLDSENFDHSELVGGIGTEAFAGLAGIVLAVLALANVMPYVLLPAAAIVYGGSLLLGGAAQPDLEHLAPERAPRYRRVTRDAIQASGGVMVMVGIASAVLGILAMLDIGPSLTLALIAMLSIGAALVIAGGALTARFARRYA